MNNSELTSQVETEYGFESAYLRAENEHEVQELFNSTFTRKVKKISRKEAKGLYLYRRADGSFKLA